jgi:hypothetical protein
MSDDLVERLRVSVTWGDSMTETITRWAQERRDAANHIEELKTKLAKAAEALDEAVYLLDITDEDIAKGAGVYRIVNTLKELTGEGGTHDKNL